MKGVVVLPTSKYYYFRFYDKNESDPLKRRKTPNTKIEVTKEDRHIYEYNHKNHTKKPYRGNAALRAKLLSFRNALVNRDFEFLTDGAKVKSSLTLSVGLEEYLAVKPNLKKATIDSYKHAMKTLIDFAGDEFVYKITTQQIAKFIIKLRESFKEASIAIITRSLGVIWNFFIQGKHASENVIPKIKTPLVKPSPILPRDLDLIYTELQKKNHPKEQYRFIRFLFMTGMRPGGAIEQRWDWIDMERKVMQVKNVKSDRFFVFPIFEDLENLLKEIGVQSAGKVFTYDKTDCLHFFARVVKKLTDEKEFPDKKDRLSRHYSLYNLRDTFASNLANSDTEMSVVQELMNHTNINITRRHYVEIKSDFLRGKLEKSVEFLKNKEAEAKKKVELEASEATPKSE